MIQNHASDWAYLMLLQQMKEDALVEIPAIEQLKALFSVVRLAKGQLFLEQDTVENRIAFVARGLLRYFYITQKGDDITKHFSIERDYVCSYASMIYQRPSAYGIIAEEDSILLVIDANQFKQMIDHYRSWEKLARKYTEHIYNLKEIREASLLLLDAKARYEAFCKDYPDINQRAKQRHIATFLGIHPVSLSRLRHSDREK